MAVAVVVVAAIVYNLPRFFERRVVIVTCHGISLPLTERTELRNNQNYFLIYKTACYFIFRAVGPLVALVVLNAELMRALRAVRRRRRRLMAHKADARGGRSGGGENLTLMLVTVVTVFILCQLPNVGIRIVNFTAGEFALGIGQLDIVTLRYANIAGNALLTLNSAVNFAVYCLVGRKFRRIFVREVASCDRCHRQSPRPDVSEDPSIRATSIAAAELARCADVDQLGRCADDVDLDETQMTELGQRPRLCGRMKSAVGRRRQHQQLNALQRNQAVVID